MSMIQIDTDKVYFFMLCYGMKIADLAKAIKVSEMVMNRILDHKSCSLVTLCNLARVLGVKPKELVG